MPPPPPPSANRGAKPLQGDLVHGGFALNPVDPHINSFIRSPNQTLPTPQMASIAVQPAPPPCTYSQGRAASAPQPRPYTLGSSGCGMSAVDTTTASSTASSSTSEGPRRVVSHTTGVIHTNPADNQARLGFGLGALDTRDPSQNTATSSKSSSTTSGSSNSSCAPLNSQSIPSGPTPPHSRLVHVTNGSGPLTSQSTSAPPPPPPRISTAISGFTLTSRP